MSEFTVDTAALLVAVERMSAFERHLEESLEQVRASVKILGQSWTGDAAEGQRAAQEQWNSGAAEMRQALAELQAIAERAHENYSGATAMNLRMWS